MEEYRKDAGGESCEGEERFGGEERFKVRWIDDIFFEM